MSTSSSYAIWARALTDERLVIDLQHLAANIRLFGPEQRAALLREAALRLSEPTYRVVSDKHGLVWTGADAERAKEVALVTAVNTARTTYLQEGTDN